MYRKEPTCIIIDCRSCSSVRPNWTLPAVRGRVHAPLLYTTRCHRVLLRDVSLVYWINFDLLGKNIKERKRKEKKKGISRDTGELTGCDGLYKLAEGWLSFFFFFKVQIWLAYILCSTLSECYYCLPPPGFFLRSLTRCLYSASSLP